MEANNNIRKVEGDKGKVRKLLVSQAHPHGSHVGLMAPTTIALTCALLLSCLLTLSTTHGRDSAKSPVKIGKEDVYLFLLPPRPHRHLPLAEPNQKQPQGSLGMYLTSF